MLNFQFDWYYKWVYHTEQKEGVSVEVSEGGGEAGGEQG